MLFKTIRKQYLCLNCKHFIFSLFCLFYHFIHLVHCIFHSSCSLYFSFFFLHRVKGGELFEYITTKDNLNDEEASLFIRQILLGLEHLHNKNIAHLDLKPENVMLCDTNSCQIKLIDFGLSRKITSKEVKGLYGTPEFVGK